MSKQEVQVRETVRMPWHQFQRLCNDWSMNPVEDSFGGVFGKPHKVYPWMRCLSIESVKRVTLFSSDEAELVLGYGVEEPQFVMSVAVGKDETVITCHCRLCNATFHVEQLHDARCPHCKRKQGEE